MDWDMDDTTLFALGGERLTIVLVGDVPLARVDFDDQEDTKPDGKTIIGPLFISKRPAPTPKVSPLVPMPDEICNEIDDDDDPGGRTITGPPMTPRRPAPRRK